MGMREECFTLLKLQKHHEAQFILYVKQCYVLHHVRAYKLLIIYGSSVAMLCRTFKHLFACTKHRYLEICYNFVHVCPQGQI